MVVSSTDGTVEATFQPDNLRYAMNIPDIRSKEARFQAMSRPDNVSRLGQSVTNKFLIDLDEKLDLKGRGDSTWARVAWITGRNTSVRDILTMLGGCDVSAIPAKKLIMMGGLKFFEPDVRLPMPFFADERPGFEKNAAEMRPRFKAVQSYLRCHVHKTKCTACCTSLPLSLCDMNSLFECTTAVVTITDKLGMLQAWLRAKPGVDEAEWFDGLLRRSMGSLERQELGEASWLGGLLPPSYGPPYGHYVPNFGRPLP